MNKDKSSFRYKIYWLIINLARSNNVFRIIIDVTAYIFYKLFRGSKTFYFQGKRYHYFYHPYNRTVASERVVEIPLAKRILDHYAYKDGKVLEIGNVLAHYFPISHDVLDKYERTPGVINKDVVNFNPKKKYDLILSISTMEHVGWTYGERKDKNKFLMSIKNLTKYLAKRGELVVTFPLFYRDDITKLIMQGEMPFKKEYFMKRISFLNEWVQVSKAEAFKGKRYDDYFANANILYIGFYYGFLPTFVSSHAAKPVRLSLLQSIKGYYRFVKAFFEDL